MSLLNKLKQNAKKEKSNYFKGINGFKETFSLTSQALQNKKEHMKGIGMDGLKLKPKTSFQL